MAERRALFAEKGNEAFLGAQVLDESPKPIFADPKTEEQKKLKYPVMTMDGELSIDAIKGAQFHSAIQKNTSKPDNRRFAKLVLAKATELRREEFPDSYVRGR